MPCVPFRYEWSVGDESSSSVEPAGVFDSARDRVWFDVGDDTQVRVVLAGKPSEYAGEIIKSRGSRQKYDPSPRCPANSLVFTFELLVC